MSEEFLIQIGRRNTKGSSPASEKARKYMRMWAFKLNCSMDKHQVSLICFISCINERTYFVWVCLALIRSNKRGKSVKLIHHNLMLCAHLGNFAHSEYS